MELKIFNHFVVQFLLICFLVKGSILVQANQETGDGNEQSSSYFFYQRHEYPRDCKEIQQQCSAPNSSGVHLIQPNGFWEPFFVYCEDEWTVIQRRVNDFIDFNRNWTEYNNGFGFLNSDFWVGNEKLAYLTNQKQYELNISFETEKEESYHVTYSMFRISDSFSKFTIVSVGEFTGTLGDLPTRPPTDCYDIQQAGNTTSGDYIVNPTGWSGGPFTINCNMTIDGGGWTVFQRRIDGTVPFNRNWTSYKEGFGNPSGEFWMGNDKLAFLTNQKEYELRIDLINREDDPYYAKYDLFRITDESNDYRLFGIGNFSGTAASDALKYHNYQAFSTIDRDNDVRSDTHCANRFQSAWWYHACSDCDLNRPYSGRYTNYWDSYTYIKYIEMKIRPKNTVSS